MNLVMYCDDDENEITLYMNVNDSKEKEMNEMNVFILL